MHTPIHFLKRLALFASMLLCGLTLTGVSLATVDPLETGRLPTANRAQPTLNTPSAPPTTAETYILVEPATGKVLAAKDSEKRMEPASLTKMMTMYLISDALKKGHIRLDDEVLISENAWRTGGSRMFVKVGSRVPVHDLIRGIVIVSGNDACVAMAEHLAGSEEAFAELMNQQAKSLGMKNSHFTDSTGMPAPDHYTTAHDMAILANALIRDFPEYYPWYKEKEFTYNNIHQVNRNRLLWTDPNVDGIKTGHTDSAGYCLVASAKQGDMRLVSAVLRAPSPNKRTEDTRKLFTYGFRFFHHESIYKAGQPIATPRVWYGQEKTIPVGVTQDLAITLSRSEARQIKTVLELPDAIKAPVSKGQVLGHAQVILNNEEAIRVPVIALADDPKGGLWQQISDAIGLLFHRFFGDDTVVTLNAN